MNHEKIVRYPTEFYLCSHNCDKGTIRSTHYCVLQNESGLAMSDLQQFTYNLCYLFAKSAKSISIPVPVKYAHLAAYRARSHLSLFDKKQTRPQANPIPVQPIGPFYLPINLFPPPVLPPPIAPFQAGLPFLPPPFAFMPPVPPLPPFVAPPQFVPVARPAPAPAPAPASTPAKQQKKKKGKGKGKKEDAQAVVVDAQVQNLIKVHEDLSLCFYFL